MRLPDNQKAIAKALALLSVAPVLVFNSMLFANHGMQLVNRSLRVGTSTPSAITDHTFGFDISTPGTVGSLQFEYCENSPLPGDPCTPPVGLSLTSATLTSQTGEIGFSIHPSSTGNKIILTRPPAAATPQSTTYAFNNVTNPSAPSTSFFVRLGSFASDDGSGNHINDGSLVFSTSGSVSTVVFVPPYLTFCVAVSVAPDCSSASGYSLDMGEFSKTSPKAVTSQFAGATNDVNGYVATLLGTTMTSGNNIIDPLAAPTPSNPGTSQFGINLRSNATPVVGQNPLGAGTAVAASDFNIPNRFVFKNGTLVASPFSTDYNTFTVSYIVNVSSAQPPGIYATTVTYLGVAQF